MEDGVAMEIGRSAQLNVAEDLRFGVENVPALLQLMVERSVREIWTNLGNVIPTPVQLMANGVAMEIGRSAQLNVAVEPKYGVESVLALLQLMVERSVREMLKKVKSATSNRVQETEIGLAGVIGQSAQLNVVEELNLGAGPVTTHPQLMEVQTVRGTLRKLDPVTPTLV